MRARVLQRNAPYGVSAAFDEASVEEARARMMNLERSISAGGGGSETDGVIAAGDAAGAADTGVGVASGSGGPPDAIAAFDLLDGGLAPPPSLIGPSDGDA